jgi:hypothetical protein
MTKNAKLTAFFGKKEEAPAEQGAAKKRKTA